VERCRIQSIFYGLLEWQPNFIDQVINESEEIAAGVLWEYINAGFKGHCDTGQIHVKVAEAKIH